MVLLMFNVSCFLTPYEHGYEERKIAQSDRYLSLTSPGLHLSRKPPIRFLNCREVVQEVYVCQPYLSSFNYQHQPNNSSTATLNPLSTTTVCSTSIKPQCLTLE